MDRLGGGPRDHRPLCRKTEDRALMPSNQNPRKPAAEPRRIPEFEGARSKPKPRKTSSKRSSAPAETQATGQQPQRSRSTAPRAERTRDRAAGTRKADPSAEPSEATSLVDPRSDPEVMFRILSDKIAAKVDRAAMKAGASAAQEVGRRLTAELDAAIAGAQSTAGQMGALVQQAVQAAVDEALRTAVLNATRVHEEHLAQLALIDRTAQTAGDISAVRLRVEQEMRRSGLTRITEPDPEAFNLANPTEHAGSTAFEVLAPAYADSATGRIVQRGEMRRVAEPAQYDLEGGSDR
ncbi:hypothetical protein [Streptomyces sp. SP2-10]|uniref:hypothetical protein n=1 Tax=Streptomyces sp. SP2-10 TaxID=2873385 RepID=UPI001CA6C208|nr:hypothetical protein [Streptomyces sp. SP2-10]MBY8845822.1 hypothetical protein [Streptomyces sp. SP2-10]